MVEEAIQGTAYVSEIYERVQKATEDLNLDGQINKHYEYQVQIDQQKQDLIAAQRERDMLKLENKKLIVDIGILSKVVIKEKSVPAPLFE